MATKCIHKQTVYCEPVAAALAVVKILPAAPSPDVVVAHSLFCVALLQFRPALHERKLAHLEELELRKKKKRIFDN